MLTPLFSPSGVSPCVHTGSPVRLPVPDVVLVVVIVMLAAALVINGMTALSVTVVVGGASRSAVRAIRALRASAAPARHQRW